MADGPQRSHEDRRPIEGGILVSAWYPFSLFIKIGRLLEVHFGGQVLHLHREMGRAAAEYGLTTFYKILFKLGSPQFITSKAASLWRTYNSSGEMTVPVCEKGHAIVELAGFAEPARELCEGLPGFLSARSAFLRVATNKTFIAGPLRLSPSRGTKSGRTSEDPGGEDAQLAQNGGRLAVLVERALLVAGQHRRSVFLDTRDTTNGATRTGCQGR